jgi:hypothetical protein
VEILTIIATIFTILAFWGRELIWKYLAKWGRIFVPKRYKNPPINITERILNRELYIHEKIHNFVGRKFVFDAIDKFINSNPRGYFVIKGDPGIGKSSIAAQLIKTHNYIHHFNIRSEGSNRAENFLSNVCSQLIKKFDLSHYENFPPEATQDGKFLLRLFNELSEKQQRKEEKVIIVVDALDEVDHTALAPGVNWLYLPLILPMNVYMIVTMRRDSKITLQVQCELMSFEIKQDSESNMTDIRKYISGKLELLGIKRYMNNQHLDDHQFIEQLSDKSQGNFMYLRHVIPEIEKGAYSNRSIGSIPLGLKNYYEDHWQRIQGHDENAWVNYKLRIIGALSVIKKPISVDIISEVSKVPEREKILIVLQEWQQFLHVKENIYQGNLRKCYRWYHDSFLDFLAEKVDVKEMHGMFADELMKWWKSIKKDL